MFPLSEQSTQACVGGPGGTCSAPPWYGPEHCRQLEEAAAKLANKEIELHYYVQLLPV